MGFNKIRINAKEDIINWSIFLGLVSTLVVGIFNHGIFLKSDFLITSCVIGLVSFIYIFILKNGRTQKIILLDILIMLLGIAYSAAVVSSANVDLAINQALKIWTYILFYFVLSNYFINVKHITIFVKVLIFTGVANTIFGLLTVIGWVNYELSWTDVLSSTIQYHNAYASFLIPLIFFASFYAKIESTEVKYSKYIYYASVFILSFGLAGSQSRGAYIVIMPMLVIYYLVIGRSNKSNYIITIFNIFTAFVLWDKFIDFTRGGYVSKSILIFIIGLLVSLISIYIMGRYEHIKNYKLTKYVIIIISITILVFLVLFAVNSDNDVINRISKINLNDHSVEERYVFYSDSFKMLSEKPILGFGGGGWAAAYQAYQSYLYYSTEPHGILFSVMVDTGVFGLSIYVLILINVLLILYKLLKKHATTNKSQYEFTSVVAISITTILLHAMIDFNLSKGALSLLVWGLFAIVKSMDDEKFVNKNTSAIIKNLQFIGSRQNIVLGFVAIGLIIIPILIYINSIQVSKALTFANNADFEKTIKHYQSAIKFYPFDAKNYLDLANIKAIHSKTKNVDEIVSLTEKSITLNKYDTNIHTATIEILTKVGQVKKAYIVSQKVKEFAPFHNEVYETFGRASVNYLKSLIISNNLNEAKNVYMDIEKIEPSIDNKLTKLTPLHIRNWIEPKKLEYTDKMKLFTAQANLMNGNIKPLETLVENTNDTNVKIEAKVWLAAIAMVNEDEISKQLYFNELTKEDIIQAQLLVPLIAKLEIN